MLKEEFEALYGEEISQESYERIEVVYNALPNCSKESFVRMYKELPIVYADVASVIRRMNSLEQSCKGYRTHLISIGKRLIDVNEHLDKAPYDEVDKIATDCMGDAERLKHKILCGYELTESDREQVETLFNNLKE